MADRQISLSALIRKLETRRAEHAEKLVANGGKYEDFLIGTGKYRENRALVQYLEALIDKDPRPVAKGNVKPHNEPDDLDPDDDDEDEDEAPAPAPVVRAQIRRSKPRAWGS